MKIAYIHYHLNTGGVTTVLRHQVDALRKTDNILVLIGEPGRSIYSATTVVIDGLGYDIPTRASPPAQDVADSILAAIHSHFNGPCDLLHVHNPTIAKNRNFLNILNRLQQTGIPLFLQIHDLAEDGRPRLFYQQAYPADCHFGVINSRDYGLLRQGGLKSEGLHLIPNMVKVNVSVKGKAGSNTIPNDIVLYPIRAIRRKNIGEAILLSLFFQNSETLVITLPPNSPMDVKAYEGWIQFVQANNLNVVFDAGLKQDFGRLVQNARFLLTTSIAEGFGFSFLEPWLAGKLLYGRKLPDICRDFEDNGIVLDHMYSQLLIALDWLPRDSLSYHWKTCMRNVMRYFGISTDPDDIDRAFSSVTIGNRVDFGLLGEAYQKRVIDRIVADRSTAKELVRINPFLAEPGNVFHQNRLVEINRRAVSAGYNTDGYRHRIRRIYDRVTKTKVSHCLSHIPLLDYFLEPSNFSLLKWCDYVES